MVNHIHIDVENGFRDYRSKTEALASFKTSIRGLPNEAVAYKLSQLVGATGYDQFLAEWHPRDYIYTCLLKTRDFLTRALSAIHAEKYPDEPLRIRYTSCSKDKSGEEEFVPRGDRLPANSEPAYVTTYTSCQGETAGPDEKGVRPRVWITDLGASEFFPGALYTGATRVELETQLGYLGDIPFNPWARGTDDVYA